MGNPLIPTNSAPYAKKVQHTESVKNILSSTDSGGRILRFMTRARTASSGVAKLTAIQPLLGAVLMLCVSLVQGAATTLRMIFKRNRRDWHTIIAREALPQATSGISSQGTKLTHGVILGLVPRIPVGSSRGLANDPHEAINQGARHKADRDSVDVAPSRMEADPLVRVPCGLSPEARRAQGEGRGPALREAQTHAHRSALMRADQTPACAGDAVERLALRVSPARL